jgi:hypothetical protein
MQAHYFDYGSNMNWAQMKQRCPTVRLPKNYVGSLELIETAND